jgi:3-hydroxypropanoate dehydrogenase
MMLATKALPQKTKSLGQGALDQLFREARTHSAWLPKPIPDETLVELYHLTRMAPTSVNASPARFVFLKTEEAKARLLPALAPMNAEKARTAPVTVLIAWDTEFHERLPKLMPYADFRSYFHGNDALIHETAFRNSSLQGGYFILAARALGLDVGAMSGFDAEKVNAEFFPGGKWKVNFIVNLGYGDHSKLYPRQPRLDFDEAALVL